MKDTGTPDQRSRSLWTGPVGSEPFGPGKGLHRVSAVSALCAAQSERLIAANQRQV